MKKIALIALTLTLVGIGAYLLLPSSVGAIDLGCETTIRRTGAHWGMGSNCTQADNNAISSASNDVFCLSGLTCSEVPENVTPCAFHEPSGQYKSDWRIRYVCVEE